MKKISNFSQFLKDKAAARNKNLKWAIYGIGCDNKDIPEQKLWYEKENALEARFFNELKKLEPELEKAGFKSENIYYGTSLGMFTPPKVGRAVSVYIGIWYDGDGDIADYLRYQPIEIKGIDKLTVAIERKTVQKPKPAATVSKMVDKKGVNIEVGDTVAFAKPDIGGQGYYIEVGVVKSFSGTTQANIEAPRWSGSTELTVILKTGSKIIVIKSTNKSKKLGF